jgi:hypothetical protein
MDYLKEAETIYNEYKRRAVLAHPFNDAVIAYLYLFARWLMAERKVTKK